MGKYSRYPSDKERKCEYCGARIYRGDSAFRTQGLGTFVSGEIWYCSTRCAESAGHKKAFW